MTVVRKLLVVLGFRVAKQSQIFVAKTNLPAYKLKGE